MPHNISRVSLITVRVANFKWSRLTIVGPWSGRRNCHCVDISLRDWIRRYSRSTALKYFISIWWYRSLTFKVGETIHSCDIIVWCHSTVSHETRSSLTSCTSLLKPINSTDKTLHPHQLLGDRLSSHSQFRGYILEMKTKCLVRFKCLVWSNTWHANMCWHHCHLAFSTCSQPKRFTNKHNTFSLRNGNERLQIHRQVRIAIYVKGNP